MKEDRTIELLEFLIVAALFVAASAFLLKLAYLSVLSATVIGGSLSLTFYAYMRWRHGIRIPVVLLLLMFVAVEADALGNYFRLYGEPFGPIQYDEFSHMLCSALITPIVIWLLQTGIERGGYRLPPGLIAVFAVALLFSMSGFYEIIELWDERYFHGKRIWSPHDTPNDLQWNLIGAVIGAALSYAVLKK